MPAREEVAGAGLGGCCLIQIGAGRRLLGLICLAGKLQVGHVKPGKDLARRHRVTHIDETFGDLARHPEPEIALVSRTDTPT